jgi:hypothetical protein
VDLTPSLVGPFHISDRTTAVLGHRLQDEKPGKKCEQISEATKSSGIRNQQQFRVRIFPKLKI